MASKQNLSSATTVFKPSYSNTKREKKILTRKRKVRRVFTWCRFRVFAMSQIIKRRKHTFKKKRYLEDRKSGDKISLKVRKTLLRNKKKTKKIRNPKPFLSKDSQTKPISFLKISKNTEYQNSFWYTDSNSNYKKIKKQYLTNNLKKKFVNNQRSKERKRFLKRSLKWKYVNPIKKEKPDFSISSIYFCQKSVGQRSDFHNKLTLISNNNKKYRNFLTQMSEGFTHLGSWVLHLKDVQIITKKKNNKKRN